MGKEHTILWLGISIGFRGSGRGGGGFAELVYDATKLSPRGLPSKHEAIPAARTTGVGDLACSEREFAGDTGLYQALLPAGDSGEDSRSRYRLQQRQLLRLHRPPGGDRRLGRRKLAGTAAARQFGGGGGGRRRRGGLACGFSQAHGPSIETREMRPRRMVGPSGFLLGFCMSIEFLSIGFFFLT